MRSSLVNSSVKKYQRRGTSQSKPSPLLAILLFSLFLAISSLLFGCVTKAPIENVMLPFTTVRQVVENTLPGGIREQSQNGRELTSYYFSPKNWDEDAETFPERAYAKITILGSSRPFKIDVKVFRERKNRGARTHSNVGVDKNLTAELVDILNRNLADRREDRSFIDGFRAF